MSRKRSEFTSKIKLAAWERCGGRCEECTSHLFAGHIHYDHIVPDALGGQPTLKNCQVLCRSCHGAKTGQTDIPNIARAKRREANHIGAKAPSRNVIPGSRASKFKKRLDGTVEIRER